MLYGYTISAHLGAVIVRHSPQGPYPAWSIRGYV